MCQQNKEIVKRKALRKKQMDIVEQAYRELISISHTRSTASAE